MLVSEQIYRQIRFAAMLMSEQIYRQIRFAHLPALAIRYWEFIRPHLRAPIPKAFPYALTFGRANVSLTASGIVPGTPYLILQREVV